jgi:hypothetical protein
VRFKRSLWTVYIALNMLWTSILFFGIARHRESTSSLVGRYAMKGNRVALVAEKFINWLHQDEPNHCRVTYCDEEEVRDEWYEQDDWT